MTPLVCQCEVPEQARFIDCPRHGCRKTRRLVELCNLGARGLPLGLPYWQAWEQECGPGQLEKQVPKQRAKSRSKSRRPTPNPPRPPKRKYLGDRVKDALSTVGITEERVTRWIGRPCGCGARREKLNELHRWVRMKLRGVFGSNEKAARELENTMRRS